MILRHITRIKYLPNIINEDCLNPKYNPKSTSSDREYISFEIYQQNDALLNCYIHLKNISSEETFELMFDADKIASDGIDIVSEFHDGGKHTKIELKCCIPEVISQEDFDTIGQYRFVHGPVFLKYLTAECKRSLEEWKLRYFMEQLKKTIKAQVTIATADKENYEGIENRLEQLDKEINELLCKVRSSM